MSPASHLRVYRFEAGAAFEGGVVGALERVELAGDAGLLDALFVTQDAASGELQAIDLATGRADGTVAALLEFRMDPASRRAWTQRTLAAHPGGVPAEVLEAAGARLGPGEATLAVLVEDDAPTVLDDAVERCGGRVVADEDTDGLTLADVPQLSAAL